MTDFTKRNRNDCNTRKTKGPGSRKTPRGQEGGGEIMKKTAILFLSLVLLSAYSVSAALPQMKASFSGMPSESVEMLISVSSLAVMFTIAADTWLHRHISERTSITAGLLLAALAGIVPVWCRSYGIFLFSRIVLGVGLGLVNSCAITIIQNLYSGREEAFLLGLRGSMETLGGALLTLIAGGLLKGGWHQAFWIYLAALPVLVLFLLFVPARPGSGQSGRSKDEAVPQKSARPWTRGEALFMVFSMLMGGVFIFVNTFNTMRLADVVIERGLGTDQKAAAILSFLQAVGVVGGIFYGKLKAVLKGYTFPLIAFIYAASQLLFAFASSLPALYLASVFAGIGNGLMVTILLNRLSERLSGEKVATGTHVILIGCNVGASMAPVIMKLLGKIHGGNPFLFLACAVLLAVIGGIELIRAR